MNRSSSSSSSSNSSSGTDTGSNRSFIGIDISAKTVDVAHRQGGRVKACFTGEQTGAGHAALAARLGALKPVRVVLEATGVYYLDLAVALTEASLPVSVINPKSFHHFAKLKLAHVKTDRADAALLAEYAERIEPALWVAPDRARLGLRDIGRQISRLTRDCVRA